MSAALCGATLVDLPCANTASFTSPSVWLLSLLFALDMYFAFSRYYNIGDSPSMGLRRRCLSAWPLCAYLICFSFLWFVALSSDSQQQRLISSLLLCALHIAGNALFSLSFYATIRRSFAQCQDSMALASEDIRDQLHSIRAVALLSTASAVLSACAWCAFVLCAAHSRYVVPLAVSANCALLFASLTKNQHFCRSLLCCRSEPLCEALQSPCAALRRRRASRRWMHERHKSLFQRLQLLSHRRSVRLSLFSRSRTHKSSTKCGSDSTLDLDLDLEEAIDIGGAGEPSAHSLNNSLNLNGKAGDGGDGDVQDVVVPMPMEPDLDPSGRILSEHAMAAESSTSPRSLSDILSKLSRINATRSHRETKSIVKETATLEFEMNQFRQQNALDGDDEETASSERTPLTPGDVQKGRSCEKLFASDMAFEIIRESIKMDEKELPVLAPQNHSAPTQTQAVAAHKAEKTDAKVKGEVQPRQSQTEPNSPEMEIDADIADRAQLRRARSHDSSKRNSQNLTFQITPLPAPHGNIHDLAMQRRRSTPCPMQKVPLVTLDVVAAQQTVLFSFSFFFCF